MNTKDNLIEKIKEAENLLSFAKCPDCDGSGVSIKEVTKTGVRWIDDGYGNPLPEPIPIQDFEQSQCFWCYHKDKFLSEIAALEKQIKEQESIIFKEPEFDEATVKKLDMVRELANKKAGKKEQKSKPVYDEAYLNECIKKATPNLLKIKDVNKHLAEIRGESET